MPSWVTPPTFSTGTTATAANLNILSNDLLVLDGLVNGATPITYAGTALVGGTFAAPLIIMAGTYTGTTDGAARLTIPYPTTFPNGCLTVVYSENNAEISGTSSQLTILGYNGSPSFSTSSFEIVAYASSSGTVTLSPTASIGVNYIAMGW